MKTTLTLNTGSFYFLSTVNLIKGVAAEVDLSTLSEGELKGVKAYIVSGNISSSEDITDYNAPVEETVEQKTEEKECILTIKTIKDLYIYKPKAP